MSSRQKGLFKAVPRINDMEKDMYKDIEKIARECVELTKEKYKNENYIANFLKKQKKNLKIEIYVGISLLEGILVDV